jgi:4'-phosphopantetheinyl transferase
MAQLPPGKLESVLPPRLPDGPAMHVYGIDLDAEGSMPVVEAALTAQDREDINRIRPPQQRRRMAISRGAFRLLVGAYLGLEAASVPVARDGRGKPRLRTGGRVPLHVSCSRTGGLAAFAITTAGPVGIDIEAVTAASFCAGVADLMLSRGERALYAALPLHARTPWLARAWVCKEAYLKGMGCGLHVDPACVETPLLLEPAAAPSCSAAWRVMPGSGAWYLCELEWRGAALAVAVEGKPSTLRFSEIAAAAITMPGGIAKECCNSSGSVRHDT